MNLLEQETTVTWPNEGEVAYIYSTVPKHLRKLRARDGVVEVNGGPDWGSFTVPRTGFDPFTGFKRKSKPMSPEQREAAIVRLRGARESREAKK